MDARTLRAALSAAIRVTVSTSLIGCGGNVTTNTGSEPIPDVEAPATSDPRPMLDHDSDYPAIGGSAAGKPSGGVAGGGETGPVSQGGSEQAAGGSAGAPAMNSCELVDPCLTLLEGLNLTFSDPLPSAAAKECCTVAFDVLGDFATTECGEMDETLWQRRSRFMLAGAHSSCCAELNAWGDSACTPWGPPVPPELSLEALLAWEAAA